MSVKSLKRRIFKEEHNIFREQCRKFAEAEIAPNIEKWEKDKQVSREVWKKAGQQGFLCMWADEKYGGSNADLLYSIVLAEEFSRVGHSGFGAGLHSDVVAPYIRDFANDEQKQRWLPGCVDGSIITAIAMSEPGTGSDLANITTTAIDKGDHYLLNGQKTFISNGILADLVIVAAKTNPQANPPHAGVSLLVVERGMPGFERGRKLEKIGQHGQDTAELFFNDVKVPKNNLLGKEGHGFYYLMKNLQQERLMVCIGAVSHMWRILEHTMTYTQDRKAFGRPIASFQNSQFKIAEMYSYCVIAQTFVDRLTEEHMAGEDIVAEVSAAKWWLTDMEFKMADEGLQLHGGYGYMVEYPIARDFVDSRVQRIYAGSNEIMKVIIAKKLGLGGK